MYRIFILIAFSTVMLACRQDAPQDEAPLKAPAAASSATPAAPAYRTSIPERKGMVNDFDNLFTPAQRATLDSLCVAYKSETGEAIYVITLPPTAAAPDSFDAFVSRVGNEWGVGNGQQDDGLVIGICKSYGRMRIATGKGLEQRINEAQAADVIQQSFIPFFRQGDYYGGTRNGLKAIISLLKNLKRQA